MLKDKVAQAIPTPYVFKKAKVLAMAALLWVAPPTTLAQETLPNPAYQVIEVQDGGRLKGTVIFTGQIPSPQVHVIEQNRDICGPEKTSTPIKVSDDGLENVVIALQDVSSGRALAPAPELAMQQCEFVPRVQGIVVGQRLTMRNRDSMPHKISGQTPKGKTLFSLYQPILGSKHRKLISEAGLIQIRGNENQPWTRAWLYVADNPYFTTTGPGGHFSISDIPTGTYQLIAWHELLGTQSIMITIEANDTSRIDFTYSLGGASAQ